MATTTLAQSLLAFQAKSIKLQKASFNPHFKTKYLGLESLMPEVVPVANECGLVIVQMPTSVDGVPSLTTRIIHAASGEFIESTMPLAITKPDPQTFGAALTYARRYGLMAMLGLVADEDTDGHSPRSSAGTGEPSRRPAAAEATTGDAPAANGTFASEAQRKRLFAIKKTVGIPDADLRALLAEHTGQESTAQIPKAQYDAVCQAIEAWVPFS